MKSYIREKRVICADRYMEVDIYPITEREHTARRTKKNRPSRPVQVKLNEKNAGRYLTQVSNHNFRELEDWRIDLTYSPKYLPGTVEEAERYLKLYLQKINYTLRKLGRPKAKYVCVTEHREPEGSKKGIRYHHHLILSADLPPKLIKKLWRTGRGSNAERLGLVKADPLEFFDDNMGLLELCNYFLKSPSGKKRYKCSRNLGPPVIPRPNDSKYTRRGIERIAKSGDAHDKDFWMKKYPGWELIRSEAVYNDYTGHSIYLKFRRSGQRKE